MNAALLIVTAMAMRAGGRKAFGLCKAPAQVLFHSLPTVHSPYSSPYSSLSHSLQSVLGFNVLCSPCPCRYFALPGLCFLHVFVFCGCAKRKSSMAAGVEGREGGQCCWLMTCGLNFPYSPLILLILLSPMVFLPDNLCALIAYFMAFNMCSSCCWLWGAVEIPSPPLWLVCVFFSAGFSKQFFLCFAALV